MPSISIPALQSSGGAAADYNTTVDSKYNAYNIRVAAFNVADAFDEGLETSQARWGVMNLAARKGQNDIFYGQESINLITGTGALSANSITYPFTANVKKLESGQVRAAVLFQDTLKGSIFWINETTKLLENGFSTAGDFDHTKLHSYRNTVKSYILTHSATDYLCIMEGTTVAIYSLDGNGCPNNLVTTYNNGYYGCIIVKGDKIWLCYTQSVSDKATIYLKLLSFDGATISQVGSTALVAQSWSAVNAGAPAYGRFMGGLKGNNGYFMAATNKNTTSSTYNVANYFRVDLTNTTATPTFTSLYSAASNYWCLAEYGTFYTGFFDYDTEACYLQLGTSINVISGGTSSAYGTGDYSVDSSNRLFNVYSTAGLTASLSNSLQISTTANLKYKGTDISGTLHYIGGYISMSEVYREDLFEKYLGSNVIVAGTITLDVNTTEVYSASLPGFASDQFLTIPLPGTTMDAASLNFQIDTSETNGVQYWIGFWITGGNYAAPTGTTKSGLTQGTTEWTAGGAASTYADLSF